MIKINEQNKSVKLLYLFSFDSDRKRMSVLVDNNGIIKLYCKVLFYLKGNNT
jgi:phospholipid-transporting ATPase